MRGVDIHVCEGCGATYETIGAYLNCLESHAAHERGYLTGYEYGVDRGEAYERERITRIIREHPTPYPYEGLGDGVASAFRNSLLMALREDTESAVNEDAE